MSQNVQSSLHSDRSKTLHTMSTGVFAPFRRRFIIAKFHEYFATSAPKFSGSRALVVYSWLVLSALIVPVALFATFSINLAVFRERFADGSHETLSVDFDTRANTKLNNFIATTMSPNSKTPVLFVDSLRSVRIQTLYTLLICFATLVVSRALQAAPIF